MIHGLSLFVLFCVINGEYNSLSTSEENSNKIKSPSSLRDVLDRVFTHRRANSDQKDPYFVQLEGKSYYSDGITIEDKDVIIAGV